MTLDQLSPSDLMKWAKENRSLAFAAVEARAFAECENARVRAYTVPLFQSYGFTDDDDGEGSGEPLLDPERSYLSDEEDRMAEYYRECDVLHREHGFTGPEGHCPALVADSLQRDAERALLLSFGEFVGVGDRFWTARYEVTREVLDLALRVCIQAE